MEEKKWTFVVHPGPHLDEVVAVTLLRSLGREIFPGIETAEVILESATPADSDLENGRILVGQGGGVFDDKDPLTGERLPDTCCAQRTAEWLGVENYPWLVKLLKAVKLVDGNPIATPTDLSSIMKECILSFHEDGHRAIFDWVEKAVCAIIKYSYLAYQASNDGQKIECTDYVRPTAVFDQMVKDCVTNHGGVINRIKLKLQSSEKQTGSCLEIATISRCMKIVGISDDEVVEWLATGLYKMAQQQELHFKLVENLPHMGTTFPITLGNGQVVTGYFCATNLPHIDKVCRMDMYNYAICVVRRSNGNVAVMPNAKYRMDMRGVWALIRLVETPTPLMGDVEIGDYTKSGKHPNVPNWYMMDSGAALNGTCNIRAIPTKISKDDIILIIQDGLAGESKVVDRFYELKNRYCGLIAETSQAETCEADIYYHSLKEAFDQAIGDSGESAVA